MTKQKATKKITKFDMSADDATISLVGPAVGGAANGFVTLLPKWKWKVGVPKGGPLTRPPQGAPYNPIRGTPGMGGGPLLERPGKQIDLSPRDYKWIDPAPQKWGSPAFRRAMNAAARGARFARMLKLFGPVGRALDLLGEPMELWQSTPNPGLQPYDWIGHGWTIRHSCPAGTTCSHLPATALTGIWNCGLLSPAQFATVQRIIR